ncbi:MAG: alpha/beta fold hydrolase [Anaerolineae bacterium]|nr:MAG: alpha/beta fold hydrolase [Anaerolineae bacterium]
MKSKLPSLLLITLAACSLPLAAPGLSPTPLPTPQILVATQTAAPADVAIPSTPDARYADLTIDALAARTYGGGEVVEQSVIERTDRFTRTLISYPSDGLNIVGFANVPHGAGPFPVVILLHGYIDPADYLVVDYTRVYADWLADSGFIVLHPNLRNYPPSESGPNLFRVGFAVDVLNLIAIVRETAGQPGPLERADAERIGLWGHSMGGGITLRVLAAGAPVDAAVVYGSMSGDEQLNFDHIFYNLSEEQRGLEERAAFADAPLGSISPIYFYDRIQVPVSIHHGDEDPVVPVAWSEELCARLLELGKTAECFVYAGEDHTFSGWEEYLLMRRTIEFFERYLVAGP